jgi:hypothetical protein
MIELAEREEQAAADEKAGAEAAAHAAEMRAANMDGVESLLEDMVGGVVRRRVQGGRTDGPGVCENTGGC